MQNTLEELGDLLHGINYGVTLGCAELTACTDLIQAKAKIKALYPETNPDETPCKSFSADFMWKDIHEYLSLRATAHAPGAVLTEQEEAEFKLLYDQIKNFIAKFIHVNTQIYSYLSHKGLPGSAIIWSFSWILINPNGESLFIYGCASD